MIVTRTISVPEIVWTFVALLAVIYLRRLFFRAVGNLQFLKANNLNSLREDAAKISIMIFGTLLFIVVMNLVAGLISMMIPLASPTKIHPFTYVISAIFILKSTFVALMAFIIDRSQIRLIEKARRMKFEGEH